MQANETTGHQESILILYDLRDAAAWQQAGRDREAWGREYSAIYSLDNNHVIIEFRPGGAQKVSA